MKNVFLFFFIVAASVASAQKKITVKKGVVKQDGQPVAEYDGSGGWFKPIKQGIFAPGSKDTLIKITEDSYDAQNPLWPDMEVVYKLEFTNTSLPSFYVRNAKYPGTRFMEKDVMQMIFNDTLPVMVAQNKLDLPAVEKFRTAYGYDLDKVKGFVKAVEDSIAIVNNVQIARDVKKPIVFRTVSDKEQLGPPRGDVNQVMEIYQDDVLLGRLVKKVDGGSFAKASYTFWKKIQPVTINGIALKYSPVAYCNTGNTSFDIPVVAVVGKQQYKIKGAFNALEYQIANLLVQNRLL